MVGLHFQFPNRAAGSFGTGRVAGVAEWCTLSWKRFTVVLLAFLIAAGALFTHLPLVQKAAMIVAAAPLAVMAWYSILLVILVAATFGRLGSFLSLFVVIYFFIFSRLVAQPAPLIDFSLNGKR